MFYLGGLFSSAKNFCFVLVLLSSIFILVTCKKCSENEVQNLESEACRFFRGNFDSVPDSFDGHISSELVSRHSVEQRGFENACPSSSSFCFPSTLTGFSINEDNNLEPSDAVGFQSEGFSAGLEQTRSNLSWPYQHDGIFKLLDGRLISCSMYQHDVFHEFSSHEGFAKNGQQTNVSSCISPPFDKNSKSSKSGENTETVNSEFLDGSSTPPVEIKPSVLDWGHKNMYYPSLAFSTVKNVDADNYLRIYDPYSSNSQFYPCNFSEILLAPDEIASIYLVFSPTHLGLSSAQLVLQTSFGGFLIQAKGFVVESPYLINHVSGLHISSSGTWRNNLSLFNPFDEALYAEEVTAWISTFSVNTLRSSKSICSTDEIILKNWKSQATATFTSVLNENELLFPMVLIGNHSSQWISIKNPSQKPVTMQLILNSGEVIDNCRTPEMIIQHFSTCIMMGNKTNGPTRYGFSIAKDAVTEAFIHPYGNATFGPIIFQPSNRCEWKSSVLIRNNLSGVELLSLRGFGGSFSLVLHEGYDPVQNLEFKMNIENQLNLSSPNSPPCSRPLIYAKNNGDFPLKVKKIKVSGAECGLDGFILHYCKNFYLQPGESVRLHLSYQADFSVATMQRDLEVVLASGILVIPMKASLPLYMLSLCKRSMFWMRVIKKAAFVIVFAATLLYFRVPFLLASFASRDLIKREKNPFSYVTRALDYLNMHFNWKNVFVRSVASGCSDGLAPEQGHVKPSSVENFDMQDNSGSRNLSVKVGKEKRKRRRKKKNTGAGILNQSDQSKCFEPSSKVNLLNNKVPSAGGWGPPCTCRSPFLVSTSTIAPHVRAPGTKIHNPKNVGPEKELGVEEKYTYDIWGDHLFELPLTNSKEVANISSFSIEKNYESFFVRGPQTLLSNSVLPPVSSDLEGNE